MDVRRQLARLSGRVAAASHHPFLAEKDHLWPRFGGTAKWPPSWLLQRQNPNAFLAKHENGRNRRDTLVLTRPVIYPTPQEDEDVFLSSLATDPYEHSWFDK